MEFPFISNSSHPQKELHCSKWLKHALLLTKEEMESLYAIWVSHPLISPVHKATREDWRIGKEDFFRRYIEYLEHVQTKDEIPPPEMRKQLTLLLAGAVEDLYAIAMPKEQFFIKARRPVIQLQMYHAFFSAEDQQIHPMAMHERSFSFGLQISYPQIYEDPITQEFIKVLQAENFPSTLLYQETLQWIRRNTRPFCYTQNGEEKVAPFRVGKQRVDWRGFHKQFYRLIDGQ